MNSNDILSAAMKVARRYGVSRITRDQVAISAKCSPALVSHHCGTMEELRNAVVMHAIEVKDLDILAFALGDKQYKIPAELRTAAAQHLARG